MEHDYQRLQSLTDRTEEGAMRKALAGLVLSVALACVAASVAWGATGADSPDGSNPIDQGRPTDGVTWE